MRHFEKDTLTDSDLLRYSRQIFLPKIDIAGQKRLKGSHVLIVGIGGLGSVAAQHLGASGIGRFTLLDYDRVELSNLHRQPIHAFADIGKFKATSAKETLLAVNPGISVKTIHMKAEEALSKQLLVDVDCVLDCSDNFATRQIVNALCWQEKMPLISAAVEGFQGQLSVFDARDKNAACYRCLYCENSSVDTCSANGVLGASVGVIGAMQAVETIKVLIDLKSSSELRGKLMLIDTLFWEMRIVRIGKDPACPVCASDVK